MLTRVLLVYYSMNVLSRLKNYRLNEKKNMSHRRSESIRKAFNPDNIRSFCNVELLEDGKEQIPLYIHDNFARACKKPQCFAQSCFRNFGDTRVSL